MYHEIRPQTDFFFLRATIFLAAHWLIHYIFGLWLLKSTKFLSAVGRAARCLLGLWMRQMLLSWLVVIWCTWPWARAISWWAEQFPETSRGWEGQEEGRLPTEVGRPYLLRAAAGRLGIGLCPAHVPSGHRSLSCSARCSPEGQCPLRNVDSNVPSGSFALLSATRSPPAAGGPGPAQLQNIPPGQRLAGRAGPVLWCVHSLDPISARLPHTALGTPSRSLDMWVCWRGILSPFVSLK